MCKEMVVTALKDIEEMLKWAGTRVHKQVLGFDVVCREGLCYYFRKDANGGGYSVMLTSSKRELNRLLDLKDD